MKNNAPPRSSRKRDTGRREGMAGDSARPHPELKEMIARPRTGANEKGMTGAHRE